ncbi:hypothetical protein ACIPK7_07840 [Pseudomonas sp. NPDC086581]|uniref:hypothetical protein n=1 Tax=Pseudomonas sp. NPDC086581 TaxID=3364432 RepID=UPI003805CA8B
MDRDALITVAEDLEYLSQWGPEISNAEIRRGSAVLRRLLVENAYGNAWRAIGEPAQPTAIAVDLSALLGNDKDKVIYALAGGANFRGIYSACSILNKGSTPVGNNPPPPIRENGYPFDRKFTITELLSSLSGVVDGKEFNRREVIKYIANIKGGVHLTTKERKTEEKLISRLGKIEKKILHHNTDGLLVELVAIAQAIGNSEDAKNLIKRILSIQEN